MDHTHDYYTVGGITGTNRTEYKCYTCGHRTDAAMKMATATRYAEYIVELPQNGSDHKDCYVTFSSAGNKLFQTFGTLNTTLALYDIDNNLLVIDNNNGYGQNAYFNYTVEANKPYILRVTSLSASAGETKISITPASLAHADYESITTSSSPSVTFWFQSVLKTTRVFTYTPTESGTYTFRTSYNTTYVDTCLYFVDPSTTAAAIFDDDSGGNMQALIEADLVASRTYFFVVSTQNIINRTGELVLRIEKKT